MYTFSESITSHGEPCQIAELAFNPDGSLFAATYLECNEVKIFCSRTRSLLQTRRNPHAKLDQPHALLLTHHHLIVSNRHRRDRPATLTVYRLEQQGGAPVFTLATPISNLREGHSMALRDNTLVITHCENVGSAGAMLAYHFDDLTGRITGPIDHHERVFDQLGYAKGICFSNNKDQVLVTFNAEKLHSAADKALFNLFKARNVFEDKGLRGLIHKTLHRNPPHDTPLADHNGIAVFDLDQNGRFSKEPVKVLLREAFCRLENIAINGDIVALTDTVNNQVQLFDYTKDEQLAHPVYTVKDQLRVPHAVKFSPDGELMLVSNFGLRMQDQCIHWGNYTRPRSDGIVVFEATKNAEAVSVPQRDVSVSGLAQ